MGPKDVKSQRFFCFARGKIGRGEWEEVGGRRGNKRTDGLGRRVSLIVSVLFLRRSFGLFSVDLSKGGVEGEIRACIRTRFCVVVRGCWLVVVVVHCACRGWDKRGMLREIYRANQRLRKYNHIIMHA